MVKSKQWQRHRLYRARHFPPPRNGRRWLGLRGWFPAAVISFCAGRRGAAFCWGSVAIVFLLGLLMRGSMFHPQTGDILTTVIYVGGFIGDLASGILYLLATGLGYNQPDVAGHVHDYGTKFLVAAGLLNILAMVDAFEIATGRKD